MAAWCTMEKASGTMGGEALGGLAGDPCRHPGADAGGLVGMGGRLGFLNGIPDSVEERGGRLAGFTGAGGLGGWSGDRGWGGREYSVTARGRKMREIKDSTREEYAETHCRILDLDLEAEFVLANGPIVVGSSNQTSEGEIRKALSEADLVASMDALPGQLFYSTQIPVCLWFIAKYKAATAKRRFRDRRQLTIFIDSRKIGTLIGAGAGNPRSISRES